MTNEAFIEQINHIISLVELITLTNYSDNAELPLKLRQEGIENRKFYLQNALERLNDIKNQILITGNRDDEG